MPDFAKFTLLGSGLFFYIPQKVGVQGRPHVVPSTMLLHWSRNFLCSSFTTFGRLLNLLAKYTWAILINVTCHCNAEPRLKSRLLVRGGAYRPTLPGTGWGSMCARPLKLCIPIKKSLKVLGDAVKLHKNRYFLKSCSWHYLGKMWGNNLVVQKYNVSLHHHLAPSLSAWAAYLFAWVASLEMTHLP